MSPSADATEPRAESAASPRTLAEAVPVFFAHPSPRLLVAALVVAAGLRLWLGAFSAWDLAPLAGLALFWPVQEWLIHVCILHYRPVRIGSRTLDFDVPRKHRAHHREPWRLELLFIPFGSFLYSLPLLVGIWYLVTPSTPLAWTGIAAHLALALRYEWVHFLVHTRVVPRTRLFRRLWRNHRLHHFKNEHYWFGVSMLSGDHLLRTAPDHRAVETSPTARTLGVDVAAEA